MILVQIVCGAFGRKAIVNALSLSEDPSDEVDPQELDELLDEIMAIATERS